MQNVKRQIEWTNKLTHFFEKIFKLEINDQSENYYATLHPLYTEGVVALNHILQKINDEEISLILRQTVMGNLLDKDELYRCGPGTAGFINDTYMHLLTDPKEALTTAKYQIVLQLANERHLRLEKNKADHVPGFEEHYARYFIYSYAQILGVKENWDLYFNKLNQEKVRSLFEKCIEFLPQALTLENVIFSLSITI